MDGALKAKTLQPARGARAKRTCHQLNTKIASRMKLGITAVEQHIRKDGMHRTSSQPDAAWAQDTTQTTLDNLLKSRPHPASITGSMKSKKRLRKPD